MGTCMTKLDFGAAYTEKVWWLKGFAISKKSKPVKRLVCRCGSLFVDSAILPLPLPPTRMFKVQFLSCATQRIRKWASERSAWCSMGSSVSAVFETTCASKGSWSAFQHVTGNPWDLKSLPVGSKRQGHDERVKCLIWWYEVDALDDLFVYVKCQPGPKIRVTLQICCVYVWTRKRERWDQLVDRKSKDAEEDIYWRYCGIDFSPSWPKRIIYIHLHHLPLDWWTRIDCRIGSWPWQWTTLITTHLIPLVPEESCVPQRPRQIQRWAWTRAAAKLQIKGSGETRMELITENKQPCITWYHLILIESHGYSFQSLEKSIVWVQCFSMLCPLFGTIEGVDGCWQWETSWLGNEDTSPHHTSFSKNGNTSRSFLPGHC